MERRESLKILGAAGLAFGVGGRGAAAGATTPTTTGDVASLIGSLKGRSAIVCGGAEGVFQEFREASDRLPNAVIFAVNDIGMFLRHVDHWVTIHAEKLEAWKAVRLVHMSDDPPVKTHTRVNGLPTLSDYSWSPSLLPWIPSFSGYFAMQIAWLMGANPIVLCGCHGDLTRNFFHPAGAPGQIYPRLYPQMLPRGEMERFPEFKARVRSMGGWTRDYFGGL